MSEGHPGEFWSQWSEAGQVEIADNHRLRRCHAITLSMLGGVVLIAALLVVLLFTGIIRWPRSVVATASPSPPTGDPRCPQQQLEPARNLNVNVRVFNASQRVGLAGSLATELRDRGYRVDAVGNRFGVLTRAPGVLITGPAGYAAALNLQRLLPGFDFRDDRRPEASVDVVLSERFQAPLKGTPEQPPGWLQCLPENATRVD